MSERVSSLLERKSGRDVAMPRKGTAPRNFGHTGGRLEIRRHGQSMTWRRIKIRRHGQSMTWGRKIRSYGTILGNLDFCTDTIPKTRAKDTAWNWSHPRPKTRGAVPFLGYSPTDVASCANRTKYRP